MDGYTVFDLFTEPPRPEKARERNARVRGGQAAGVLDLLRAAYPDPVSGGRMMSELQLKHPQGRVFNLREDGWDIAGDDELPLADDGTQLYRLRSLTQGEPEGPPDGALRLVVRDGKPCVRGYQAVADEEFQADLVREVEDAAGRVIARHARGGGAS